MKVSLITITYNSGKTVRDTLQSVKNQTYDNIEHIVVDGLSKDDTIKIVKEFDHVVKVVSEKDNGIYDAMNKGLGLVTGDIIGLLNSDDFYDSDTVIENMVNGFKQHNVDTIYGNVRFVDPENTKRTIRTWYDRAYNINRFYYGWMPPHTAFFVKAELYKKFGNFNTSFSISADYELMLRFLFINKASSHHIDEIWINQRAGGHSDQGLRGKYKANREDKRAWEINNIKPRFYTIIMKPLIKIQQFFRR